MALRNDLNGRIVKLPGNSAIYLVDEGRRRHILNTQTFNNLFRGWDRVDSDLNVADIDQGTPISNGAILARGHGQSGVYLVDNRVKRHITNPAAMDRYYFNWSTVQNIPFILLDFISTGPSIS